jgi:hypothetical protein
VAADAGSSYSRDGGATWTAVESTDNHQLLAAAGPMAIWSSSYDYSTGSSNGVRKLSGAALPTRGSLAARAARLQAYPNPSPDGRCTLELPEGTAHARLQVLDALGREVAGTTWATAPTRYSLDLTSKPAGLYTVQVSSNAGVLRQTITVR